MTQLKLAFLGLGLMGRPMARHLIDAGYLVCLYNRNPEKLAPFEHTTAHVCHDPAEAVRDADMVIAMVSDGMAVADLLERQGVAAAMKQGALFIDMSSIRPEEARRHAGLLDAYGIDVLDAPVSGGTKGAEEARLAIMAGGTESAFQRAKPVFEVLGRAVHVGPPGTGQLCKLANQMIVGITIGAVAEAMLLVQKGGASPAAMRAALKGGFADSTILQLHGWRMTADDFTPGARATTQLKDMENALLEAKNLGLTLPMTSDIHSRYHHLIEELQGGDLDHAALFLDLLERQDHAD